MLPVGKSVLLRVAGRDEMDITVRDDLWGLWTSRYDGERCRRFYKVDIRNEREGPGGWWDKVDGGTAI